jgi:3',5'-cyclic AMP phosphodiesterase CpdA
MIPTLPDDANAGPPGAPQCVLHLSDLHFGTERPVVVEALQALAREQGATLALMSGDVTQRARRAQFAAARRFLDGLGMPWIGIPGNHDIPLFDLPARLLRPWAGWRRFLAGGAAGARTAGRPAAAGDDDGDDLAPVHRSQHLLVVGVNAVHPWRHERGQVLEADIARAERLLAGAAPGQLRLVMAHQPVCVLRAEDDANLIIGHAAAVRRWRAAGADLFLGGHIHLPFVRRLHDADGLPPAWAVQAGTAVSHRLRAGFDNSVHLLRLRPAGAGRPGARPDCTVEQWDYSPSEKRFLQAASTPLSA